MILQALHHLADEEQLMADPDYEMKPVAWLIRVGRHGELLGIEGTKYVPAEAEGKGKGKRKPRPVAKMLPIPRQPTGRTGIKAPPCFLVDNAKYVFGLPTKDKPFSKDEGREKSSWFRESVVECANATQDQAACAVLTLLDNVAKGTATVRLPDDCASNDLFAFVFSPDVDQLVHQRLRIREFWKQKRAASRTVSAVEHRCLVTGRRISEIPLFPPIRNVPGGKTSGVGIVAYNCPAFESYGWKRNANAPVSREAAETCATALNRLLHRSPPDPSQPGHTLPRRNLRISPNTAVCYWAKGRSAENFLASLEALLQAQPFLLRLCLRLLDGFARLLRSRALGVVGVEAGRHADNYRQADDHQQQAQQHSPDLAPQS